MDVFSRLVFDYKPTIVDCCAMLLATFPTEPAPDYDAIRKEFEQNGVEIPLVRKTGLSDLHKAPGQPLTVKRASSMKISTQSEIQTPEKKSKLVCTFCRNNGEEFYDHIFKDRRGRVLCPHLRAYKCKLCGATGSKAHTVKYCPLNPATFGQPKQTLDKFRRRLQYDSVK